MQTRTPRNVAVSNIIKLRKLFEPSPTRVPTEMLPQPGNRQINLNPTTTTTSARLALRFCVDQQRGVTQTGPRQDCQEGHQPGQDGPDWTSLDCDGPMTQTVGAKS